MFYTYKQIKALDGGLVIVKKEIHDIKSIDGNKADVGGNIIEVESVGGEDGFVGELDVDITLVVVVVVITLADSLWRVNWVDDAYKITVLILAVGTYDIHSAHAIRRDKMQTKLIIRQETKVASQQVIHWE